jgi:proteasome lid subunit RPN8/RPN11
MMSPTMVRRPSRAEGGSVPEVPDAPASLRIGAGLLADLVAHAREDAPNECCGMIATRDGAAVAVHQAVNVAASPLRYEMDGLEQLTILERIEDAGCELGAIYHSHTRSAPVPSQTDINLAFYPGSLYVIVGVADGQAEVRAWRILDGEVQERPVIVEGAEGVR